MAHDVVWQQFAKELQSGRVQWLEIDYDAPEHEHYKQDYELVSSNVVVVRRIGGKDVAFQRLDDVWNLVHDEPAFRVYVQEAVAANLAAQGQ